ncbi:MAG: ABC transporter ATP-binding protein [Solitalea-like symbiont of Acarus siro]
MKIYLRFLSLVSPIHKTLIVYITTIVLAILFSSLNFTLLIPLFNVIFDIKEYKDVGTAVDLSNFSLGLDNLKNIFNSFLGYTIAHYGKFLALIYICIIIFAANLLANVFIYISRFTIEKLRIKILFKLRNAIFSKIVNLDVKYFNDSRKGDLISLASSDINIIQVSLVRIVELLSSDFLRVIVYIIVLLYISAKLTLFALIVIPISGIIIASISKKLKQQTLNSQEANDTMISLLESMIYGIKVIKAFGASKFINNRYVKANKAYSQVNLKIAQRQLLASPVSENLFLITLVILIIYGGNLIFTDTTSFNASEFITYLVIFTQIIAPLKALLASVTFIYTGVAAGQRICNLLDHPIEIDDTPSYINTSKLQNSIEFKDVHFSYIKGIEILKGISFKIPKNKVTAIVGPSGAGKSTITELLLRFYDVDSGEILLDNVNIKDINVSQLRNSIAVVSQEPILFNDTIYNNISFGLEHISKEQVEYAAKMANIHDFIVNNAEKGYKTNMGDRGLKLSGGQKQRISIARAVCHNPGILILDEATSALDARSEKLVQEALEKIMQTCTSIVIAHRLSTIKNADNIVVMEGGRVIATGNHQELMKQGGLYRHLIQLQSFN